MSVIASFQDAIIYDSDVRILESQSGWLNDRCINFFCKLLESGHYFANVTTSFRCIDPAVVSFMKLQCEDEDEFQDLACGFSLKPDDNVVFFPVNDSALLEEGSCSHWSLLVLFLEQRSGFHLDSMSGRGSGPSKQFQQARRTAEAFEKALKWRNFGTTGVPEEDSRPFTVSELLGVPQQCNSFDCGVYVLLFMQRIAQYLGNVTGTVSFSAAAVDPHAVRTYLCDNVSAESAREMRACVLEQIKTRRT